MKKASIASTLCMMLISIATMRVQSQTVFPGKKTIEKKEYFGLVLADNIPAKYLNAYWETFLDRFGKVKGKRGIYTIQKAGIPTVSANPIQITSQISSEQKNESTLFLALFVDGAYVVNYNDQTYKSAESILKEFSDYASRREEVRIADEVFSVAERAYQKLQRELEEKSREIERTEKRLIELRSEVEKGKTESANSLIDLQNKQKALEIVKGRLPVQR